MITDSPVSYVIKDMDRVLTGADAVSANGAAINKIGSATVAAIAHLLMVNVSVAASVYKFSRETIHGEQLEMEVLNHSLVILRELMTHFKGMKIRNPAFDVTPPDHIDVIVTERGMIPPHGAMIIRQYKTGLFVQAYAGMYPFSDITTNYRPCCWRRLCAAERMNQFSRNSNLRW
jgi:ribose 1,5-bisphosphate isomerase